VIIWTTQELTDPDGNKYFDENVELPFKGWDVQQASSTAPIYNPGGTLAQTKIFQAFAPVECLPFLAKDQKVKNVTTEQTYRVQDWGYWGSHVRIFMELSS